MTDRQAEIASTPFKVIVLACHPHFEPNPESKKTLVYLRVCYIYRGNIAVKLPGYSEACLSCLLSMLASWGALSSKRGWRWSLSTLFLFTLLTQSEGEKKETTCKNTGRDAREKARRRLSEERVGQKVSAAARDTVGNVAWKCSASCGSVIPLDTPLHAETWLGYECMAGWRRFFISLVLSRYLSLSLYTVYTTLHPDLPSASHSHSLPQAFGSDKPLHCHSDSRTCKLCLPLWGWRAHYVFSAGTLSATIYVMCMWHNE